MQKPRHIVIGAGSVGVNLALFLDAWGFDVDLIESGNDILLGAPQASFINHGDGFEYYKPGHRRTGEYCIDGSLVKALIYPLEVLRTDVCSSDNPIRYLVAEGAVRTKRVSKGGFISNAEYMMRHYATKFYALKSAAGMTDTEALETFICPPDKFMKPLARSEFSDVQGAVAGVHGSGFGINMPNYYALLKAALLQSRVSCHFGVKVDGIAKVERNEYEVRAGSNTWRGEQVLICSSHHIPELAGKIQGSLLSNDFPGTYYLNSMTFVKLPATTDRQKLHLSRHINFTLIEKYGCMFACIVPPSETEDGLAAIYFPDPTGSQRAFHVCKRGEASRPPSHWDALIENGLPNSDANVVATFNQACQLYPFLIDYAQVTNSVCRTAFNIGVRGSNNGTDRRVRELSPGRHAVTSDKQVSAWTAPKWTNAELTALMALDYSLQVSGREPLPKASLSGCGPTQIDVAKIRNRFSFQQLKPDQETAMHYARLAGFPERIARNIRD